MQILCTLSSTRETFTSKKLMKVTIWHKFLLMKTKTTWTFMENFAEKSKMILDQKIIPRMMQSIWKSDSIKMMICP